MEVGESIEKSIKVFNKNDYPVTVNITISGELSKYIELDETFVELDADEERSIKFIITPNEVGETENTVNFLYQNEDGQGIGFISKIIVVASGEGVTDDSDDNQDSDQADDGTQNDDSIKNQTNSTGGKVKFGIGGNGGPTGKENNSSKVSPYMPLIITGGILLIILIILIVVSGKPKVQINNIQNNNLNKGSFYKEKTSINQNKLNTKKRPKESRE